MKTAKPDLLFTPTCLDTSTLPPLLLPFRTIDPLLTSGRQLDSEAYILTHHGSSFLKGGHHLQHRRALACPQVVHLTTCGAAQRRKKGVLLRDAWACVHVHAYAYVGGATLYVCVCSHSSLPALSCPYVIISAASSAK